ncbi:MAG: hypothetical protein ACTS6P_00495 [Candidatus Hodgkinia cicadicola]
MKFPNNWSKLFRRLRCYTSKIIESNQSVGSCLTFNCLETCLTGRRFHEDLAFAFMIAKANPPGWMVIDELQPNERTRGTLNKNSVRLKTLPW